jgi:hypothetical protein
VKRGIYRVEFPAWPVPDLTLDYDPAAENPRGTAFETAVAEHALPHLRPVLAEKGRPELADDFFFHVTRDRSAGQFVHMDLVTGVGARFCGARITPASPHGEVAS